MTDLPNNSINMKAACPMQWASNPASQTKIQALPPLLRRPTFLSSMETILLSFIAYWAVTIRHNRQDWRKKSTANSTLAICIIAYVVLTAIYAASNPVSLAQLYVPILGCIGSVLGWALNRVFVEED